MKTTGIVYGVALALACLATTLKGQNIYVAISDNNAIGEYTASGATVNASLVSGLHEPIGLAISGTNLFVANYAVSTVGEYSTSGAIINASLITGLDYPMGIAVSGTNVFVVNSGNGTIGEYSTSGVTINAVLISGLNGPGSIAISGTNLFVSNPGNGTVREYTTSGLAINTSLISGLNAPLGVAVFGTNLFVGNNAIGGDTVGEYTISGATVNASLITGLTDPWGIVVLGNELFVSGWGSGTVGEYTTSGTTVNASLVSGLNFPYGIAFGPVPIIITTQPQSLFVTNGAPAAFSVSATGTSPLSYQWQFNGTNLTDGGVVSGSATSNLVLSATTANDGGNYTVIITNNYGSVTSSVAILTVVLANPQNLFVVNGNNIIEVTPGGVQSTVASGLDGPSTLAFNSAGDLFVLDYLPIEDSGIIEITPTEGQSAFTSGLYYPSGQAFNSAGDLFVAGMGGDLKGYITEFTPGGAENPFVSELQGKGALAFDSAGDLFMSDSVSDIYEFTNNNGILSSSPTVFASGLTTPSSLACNSSGDLFVSCPYAGNIVEFTPGGSQSTFASVGTAGPYGPGALAFDSAGNLFVSCNNNIIKITSGGIQSTFVSGLGGALAFGPPIQAVAQLSAQIVTNIVLPGGAGLPRVNPGLNKIYLSANSETLEVDGNTFSQTNVGSCWDVDVDVTNNNYWTVGLYSTYGFDWSSGNSAINAVPLSDCPIGISMDAPHRVVWVSAQCGGGNDPVWAVEADTDSVLAGPIGTGANGIGPVVVNPATGRLYINAANAGSKRVNPAASYALTANAFGIVMGANASANLLYAYANNGNTIQIINGAADPEVIVTNVTLPFSGGNYIGVNPALNRIYIGDGASNLVAVLNATTGQSITNISLGSSIASAGSIGVDASRNRVYVDASGGGNSYLCVVQDVGQPTTPPVITSFPPKFQTMTASKGVFQFSWNTVNTFPPVGYQVQYTTNLASGAWINLGNVITNGNTSFTRSIGSVPQGFYRVQIVQ